MLIEYDDAKLPGAHDLARIGGKLLAEQSDKRGFAAAVGPEQPELGQRSQGETDVAKQLAIAQCLGDMLQLDEFARLPVGGGEVDLGGALLGIALTQIAQLAHHVVGSFDPPLGFGGARLGAALQPFDFAPDPAGQGSFAAGLGGEKLFTLHQKLAVRSVVTQEPIGIRAAQFDGSIGDGFQKSPIVADGQRGQRWIGDDLFQPEYALDIQMIGRLIQQQQVRPAGEGADDGQAFSPSARQFHGDEGRIGQARPIQCLLSAKMPFVVIQMRVHHAGDAFQAGEVGGKDVFLGDVAYAQLPPRDQLAFVGSFQASKDAQQRRFSRTIGADKPDALAFAQSQRDAGE